MRVSGHTTHELPTEHSDHTPDELLKEYNVLEWRIEKKLKEFLAQLHGDDRVKRTSYFKPQEFDLEVRGGSFHPALDGYDLRTTDGREEINGFNLEFLRLFEEILLPQSASSSSSELHEGHHQDLLWGGILEVEEDKAKSAEGSFGESISYSLFSYHHNMPCSKAFFQAHRRYSDLQWHLYSLTNYFTAAPGERVRADKNYKPFYISVLSDKARVKAGNSYFCHRVAESFAEAQPPPAPFSSQLDEEFRRVCSVGGLDPKDEGTLKQVNKCRSCRAINDGHSDRVTVENMSQVFACPYQPYSSSTGVILERVFVERIDEILRRYEPGQFELYAVDRGALPALINEVREELATSSGVRRLKDFIDSEAICISVVDVSGKQLKAEFENEEEQLKKFINYLIWLRLMGVAGGAPQNWTSYFYFPIPDLSGNYLHTITVASRGPMDTLLFHLIDRNTAKLFQRSVLRLVAEEKAKTIRQQQLNALERENKVIRALNHRLKSVNANMRAHLDEYIADTSQTKYLYLFDFITTSNSLTRKYHQYMWKQQPNSVNLVRASEFFRSVIFQCLFWSEGNFTLEEYDDDLLRYASSYLHRLDPAVGPGVLKTQWDIFRVDENYFRQLERLLETYYNTRFVLPDDVYINITDNAHYLNKLIFMFSEIVGNFLKYSRDADPDDPSVYHHPVFSFDLVSAPEAGPDYVLFASAKRPVGELEAEWLTKMQTIESYMDGQHGMGLVTVENSFHDMGIGFKVFQQEDVFMNVLLLNQSRLFTRG